MTILGATAGVALALAITLANPMPMPGGIVFGFLVGFGLTTLGLILGKIAEGVE